MVAAGGEQMASNRHVAACTVAGTCRIVPLPALASILVVALLLLPGCALVTRADAGVGPSPPDSWEPAGAAPAADGTQHAHSSPDDISDVMSFRAHLENAVPTLADMAAAGGVSSVATTEAGDSGATNNTDASALDENGCPASDSDPECSEPPLAPDDPLMALPLLVVGRVLAKAEGSYTKAAIIQDADGRKLIIKSRYSKVFQGKSRLTRYSNSEADILSYGIFQETDIKPPRAWLARIEAQPEVLRRVGHVVLVEELLNADSCNWTVVPGRYIEKDRIALDEFIDMSLVDVIIANADRHTSNFFLGFDEAGLAHPMPIDSNSGFTTPMVWFKPSNLINFFATYEALGSDKFPWKHVGTVFTHAKRYNVLRIAAAPFLLDPKLEERVVARAQRLADRLPDGRLRALVDALPYGCIPASVTIDTSRLEWLPAAQNESVSMGLLFPTLPLGRPVSGVELWEARKAELRQTLVFRVRHLVEALRHHYAVLNTPSQRLSAAHRTTKAVKALRKNPPLLVEALVHAADRVEKSATASARKAALRLKEALIELEEAVALGESKAAAARHKAKAKARGIVPAKPALHDSEDGTNDESSS